jgi:hypothetical protein
MNNRKITTPKPLPSRLAALERALAAAAQLDLPVIRWDDSPVRRTPLDKTPELIAALAALGAAVVREHLERRPRFS